MAERDLEPEAEAEEIPEPESPVAAAIALALGRRGRGAKDDPRLDAFLDRQTRLIELQTEHLHEQRELQLAHLRVRRWKDRVSLALQVLGVVVGAAILIGVGVMAWRAHEDHGLVIDAFSVPPDLARDGLTGEVAAGRFLDKLQALQAATADSDRPAQSFQNDWESQIKVEIPETGLTFSEFDNLLREKLGRVSHVSGEVLKTPTGISVTARYGDAPPQTFAGGAGDFDVLAQKAAEAVYRASQPYRYAEYLDEKYQDEGTHWDEAFKVIADLAANGQPSERGWAYAKWAQMDLNDHGDVASERLHASRGLGYAQGSDLEDEISLVNAEVWSGHEEADLAISRRLDVMDQKRAPDTSELFFTQNKLLGRAWLQFVQPDYSASAATWTTTGKTSTNFATMGPAMAATALALDHDLGAARRVAANLPPETSYIWSVAIGAFVAEPAYWSAAEAGDWRAAFAEAKSIDAWLEANKAQRPIYGLMQTVWIRPIEALAQAKAGDPAGAQALIEATPFDCYLCLRVRGRIAAGQRDWPAAERWFAEAVRQGPSLPFAYAEWGQMLLDKGDPDGAILKLSQARERAPRFADPKEAMGEALVMKRHYADAAARFAAADEDAPNWGRNHLEWGEALMLAGRYREARAQFEAANKLDLSTPDHVALDVLLARTARGPLSGG